MTKILLTGASGFIGSTFLQKEKSCRIVTRSEQASINSSFYINGLDSETFWDGAFDEIECVVHLAGLAHSTKFTLQDYTTVNVDGTVHLAKEAAKSGVKRFIFLSSIKVNGESTTSSKPFTAKDNHNPIDPYGKSKAEAELQLLELGKKTGMEIVIIRPPLVYGPGVKANFASLMRLVGKGVPLPFGCICDNKRSLVSVTNLSDLIRICISHPNAANQIFLVSDGRDISTSEMVKEMAKALGAIRLQLPVPKWCYIAIGRLFGKQDIVDRLLGSLQVDITHTKETLNWSPPQSPEEGFKETAKYFDNQKK